MSHSVERLTQALSGLYQIERQVGEGAMAAVYLADDLRHGRRVALKVLKPELAAVLGAERFFAEIRTTAKLQHPHVVPLYDSGEAEGFLYYVMPYVGGESLRARLDREKQLPVEEAVRIVTAVAEALDYAHHQGVIHRDIKPENILLVEGTPLVADFGIALAITAAGGQRMTETGVSMGTPMYMSPEQVMGERDVDQRTDVYALGCVLYEMLGGRPPHTGSTAQAVLGSVLASEPVPVARLRKTVPPNVDAALAKALEKTPADRFAGAKEFATALADTRFRYGESSAARGASGFTPGYRMAGALGVGLIAALGWWLFQWRFQPERVVARFEIPLPRAHSVLALSLSPDGKTLFYAAEAGATADVGLEGRHLFRRPLDELEVKAIPGSEGAREVAVSPDGQWVAFTVRFTEARMVLRKTPPLGGGTVDVAEHRFIRGFVWDPPDQLIGGSHNDGLWRVPIGGGKPEPLTDRLNGPPHRFPALLPGRRGLLFHIGGNLVDDQVAVLPRGSTEWRVITQGSDPRYLPTGHIVFYRGRDASIWAAPFDLKRLEMTAEPVPVVIGVAVGPGGRMQAEWSHDGTLFYVPPRAPPTKEVVWVTRDGVERPTTLAAGDYAFPELSPDGKTLLLHHPTRVWLHPLDRDVAEPLTGESFNEWKAIWSPRGSEVVFMSRRGGPFDLYRANVGGTRAIEPVGTNGGTPHGWTADGSGLIYSQGDQLRIWRWSDSSSQLLVSEPVAAARLSPDGDYLAYAVHDATGNTYIEVRPYPDVSSGRWRLSQGGALNPRWSPNGRELYYGLGTAVMAVAVNPSADRPFGVAERLFEGPYTDFDVAPDGRLLMLRSVEPGTGEAQDRIHVVVNWFDELKRLVPR